MKKLTIILSLSTAILFGCGKVNVTSNEIASVHFINAAPGSTTHNVIVDDINQTGSSLVFRGATASYLNLAVGSRSIKIRSNNPSLPVDYVTIGESFANNTASTIVTYDVLATPTSNLKYVRFTDDLTTPKAGFIKVRYLPLAIGVPNSDITYLRTSNILPILPDSVTVPNINYIGTTPTAATIADLSKFYEIPAGAYTIKIKAAGTQTVLTSASFSTAIAGVPRGIYTLYGTGNIPASIGFGWSLMRNYP